MKNATQPTFKARAATNAPLAVPDTDQGPFEALMQDMALFIRSGAADTPECFDSFVEAMRKYRKLTKRQAQRIFQAPQFTIA